MPFDGSAKISLESLGLGAARGREGLRRLAALLDAEELWEQTHEWDFAYAYRRNSCGTAGCALGLAHAMWPEFRAEHRNGEEYKLFGNADHFLTAERFFNLSRRKTIELFGGNLLVRLHKKSHADIGPGEVATAIREYLARTPE